MCRRFVLCLAALCTAVPCLAGERPSGLYACKFEGPGQRVPRNDGGEIILGEHLSGKLGAVSIRCLNNANSEFVFEFRNAGPIPKGTASSLAIVIDDVCAVVHSRSDPHDDGTIDLGCRVVGEKSARKLANRLKAELPLRKHPGHRFQVRWLPQQEEFFFGAPVTVKLEIRNTGDKAFSFQVGGQQRGARDNQFRFLAYHSHGGGKAVPDTGDPDHHGGKSIVRTLKPGETFEKSVTLNKWFAFPIQDTYRVTGIYEMELYSVTPDGRGDPIWDDLAIGECFVRIVPRK